MNQLVVAVEQWGKDRNIIGEGTAKQQMLKLVSEMGELADALGKGDKVGVIDGIGDCIVVLTMMAAQERIGLQVALAHAYNEIKDRKGVLYNGVFIKESDPLYEPTMRALAIERDHFGTSAAPQA